MKRQVTVDWVDKQCYSCWKNMRAIAMNFSKLDEGFLFFCNKHCAIEHLNNYCFFEDATHVANDLHCNCLVQKLLLEWRSQFILVANLDGNNFTINYITTRQSLKPTCYNHDYINYSTNNLSFMTFR